MMRIRKLTVFLDIYFVYSNQYWQAITKVANLRYLIPQFWTLYNRYATNLVAVLAHLFVGNCPSSIVALGFVNNVRGLVKRHNNIIKYDEWLCVWLEFIRHCSFADVLCWNAGIWCACLRAMCIQNTCVSRNTRIREISYIKIFNETKLHTRLQYVDAM